MQGMSSAANTAVWRVCNCAFWCTSSCREESKFTIAQAKGQCNVTVSGGCDGCGPVRTATPHIYPGCPYHIYGAFKWNMLNCAHPDTIPLPPTTVPCKARCSLHGDSDTCHCMLAPMIILSFYACFRSSA